jgi:hypothetical protein
MHKKCFFALVFMLAFLVSCDVPTPTASPIVTPTPFESPLAVIEGPKPVEEEKSPMDMDAIYRFLAILDEAARATQLYTILGLIAVDFVMGVAAAIRNGEFDWSRLAEFYRTNVMPYGLGYFCLYVVFAYVPGLEGMLGEGLQWTAFGVLTANLLGSIAGNLSDLGIALNR